MTDRELLELAAKAAGYTGIISFDGDMGVMALCNPAGTSKFQRWNPLTDDGDALRLAVALKLWTHSGMGAVLDAPDPYAATRRAIVRAAAEIGRNMK